MNYIKYIIPIILASILIITSCDVIEPPYTESGEPIVIDTAKKKVLLEDITGFRCGNCPEAAAIAHEISERYKGNVIVIAVHAGALSIPTPTRRYNFTTDVGRAIEKKFNLPATPYGLVNRTAVNGQHLLSPKAWASATLAQLQLDATYKINLKANYEESTRTINLEADVKSLGTGSTQHFIAAYIIEDSVIQYQQDDRLFPNIHVEDFVHMHVLRGSMNGSWGTPLSDTPLNTNQVVRKNLSFVIPTNRDWVPKNLSLVVFIRDDQNDEVLQVEKIKLIK